MLLTRSRNLRRTRRPTACLPRKTGQDLLRPAADTGKPQRTVDPLTQIRTGPVLCRQPQWLDKSSTSERPSSAARRSPVPNSGKPSASVRTGRLPRPGSVRAGAAPARRTRASQDPCAAALFERGLGLGAGGPIAPRASVRQTEPHSDLARPRTEIDSDSIPHLEFKADCSSTAPHAVRNAVPTGPVSPAKRWNQEACPGLEGLGTVL